MTINELANVWLQEEAKTEYCDTSTLSYRLKLCLQLYRLSQSDLARMVGVKPQIIQYLCNKNVKSSRFTFELAEALGVDYMWLSTGSGTMRPTDADLPQEHKVPLVAWTSLDRVASNAQEIESSEYVYTSFSKDCKAIATKLEDISMEPRFDKGTTLIFDMNCKPQNGDFVLVYLKKLNLWVFREYMLKLDGSTELTPMNATIFKGISLDSEDKIMGVLIQTICDFKRDRTTHATILG